MIYAPHTLQVRTISVGFKDENGDKAPDVIAFATIGNCRCNDNGVMKRMSINGEMYDYSYHIVYEGDKIDAGSSVRVLEGERVRAEGGVIKSAKCNRLNYAEIWL